MILTRHFYPSFILVCLLILTVRSISFIPNESLAQEIKTPPTEEQNNQQLFLVDSPDQKKITIAGAREYLSYLNVSDSHWDSFHDERPLVEDEKEALLTILYRLPRLPHGKILDWRKQDFDLQQINVNPSRYRGEIFLLDGSVQSVERISVAPLASERFEFAKYYRSQIQLDRSNLSVIVYSRKIPSSWELNRNLDKHVSLNGMFLKFGPEYFFAAERIAWHPESIKELEHLALGNVLLGKHGMDVGLFDELSNGKKLLAKEEECFYQLLASVSRIENTTLKRQAEKTFDFPSILLTPQKHHGRLLTVQGTARRAIKILVNDEDIRQRFGIDHYYEVDVFMQLQQPLRLRKREDDQNGPTYKNYPVVCCLRRLPAGLSVGDRINIPIQLEAFFFKLWAYSAEYLDSQELVDNIQLTPLLVGLEADVIKDRPITSRRISWWLGGAFLAALLGLWLGSWLHRHEGKRIRPRDSFSAEDISADLPVEKEENRDDRSKFSGID